MRHKLKEVGCSKEHMSLEACFTESWQNLSSDVLVSFWRRKHASTSTARCHNELTFYLFFKLFLSCTLDGAQVKKCVATAINFSW